MTFMWNGSTVLFIGTERTISEEFVQKVPVHLWDNLDMQTETVHINLHNFTMLVHDM
ncbi:UNVERIFIED_CONTAM: hypothetical protein FKN15_010804 [Acipenser sinensis]